MSDRPKRYVQPGDTHPPIYLVDRDGPLDLGAAHVTMSVDGGPFEPVDPVDPSRGGVPLPSFIDGSHTIEFEVRWGDGPVQSLGGDVEVVES